MPKIIQITTGDHYVSPHLTSLQSGDLYHKKNQLTQEMPAEKFQEEKPFEFNFVQQNEQSPKPVQEKKASISERIAKKIASIREANEKKQKPKKRVVSQKRKFQPKAPATPIHTPLRARATIAFIVLALAIVTPLKAFTTFERIREAKHDVENLKTAAGDGVGNSFDAVSSQITDALKSFHSANTTLKEISPVEEFILKNTPVVGSQYGVATRLVGAGEHVSFAAASYMQLFRTLKEKQDAPLIERLSMFFEGNRAVVSDLQAAADLVRPIDPQDIPETQRAFVTQARDAILALSSDAEYLASFLLIEFLERLLPY